MIEKTVLDYLSEKLSADVVMEVPKNKSAFVLVEKTGSSEDDHLYSATIAIQSWHESLLKAAELNEEVKTAMKEITLLDEICRCRLNSDYNYTDTSTKSYRYQAVYDIVHY